MLETPRAIILWTSLPFLILMLPVYHAPESPRFLLAQGQLDKAAAVFSTLAKYNGKLDHQEPVLKQAASSGKKASMVTLTKPFLIWTTLKMMLLWFTASLCYYGLTLNLGGLHPNPNVSLSLSGIVELPAYFICYFMMENPKLGRQKSTAIFNAGLAGACILTTIAFWVDLRKMVLVLALIGKFFGAAAFTMVYVWGAELFPTDIRSNGLAVSSVTARVGGIIAPQLPVIFSDANSYLFLTFFGFCASIGIDNKMYALHKNYVIITKQLLNTDLRFQRQAITFLLSKSVTPFDGNFQPSASRKLCRIRAQL